MTPNLPILPSAVGSPPYGAGGVPTVFPPSSPATVKRVPPRPLLSPAARKAAIELASSLKNYEVIQALETGGLRLPQPEAAPEGLTRMQTLMYVVVATARYGTSSAIVGGCFDTLDWSRPDHLLRALDVIGELLWLYELRLEEDEDGFYGRQERALRLRRLLGKEGYHIDDNTVIHPAPQVLALGGLEKLRDPSAIRAVLARINKALPDDPALAIGSAKELVEATAKTVLVTLGLPVNEKADLPTHVYEAERALKVHPQSVADGVDGAPEIRRVLGSLNSLTNNVTELRNKLGTGHGVAALPEGLRPRHGRLAVATADAWCSFMLDTLIDPEAAWRKTS